MLDCAPPIIERAISSKTQKPVTGSNIAVFFYPWGVDAQAFFRVFRVFGTPRKTGLFGVFLGGGGENPFLGGFSLFSTELHLHMQRREQSCVFISVYHIITSYELQRGVVIKHILALPSEMALRTTACK